MTDTYLINFDKMLGRGATAKVYLGIRSVDGSLCAMKCSEKPLDDEINTMKNLNHCNIIKFYDSLLNYERFAQVIVMEYCNKGSLCDFTDLHRGLCDNMFMKVLECLANGLSYLRDQHKVHRDIKPGNIMVHQDCLGFFHLKLGDLGTVKQLDDGQTFTTLIGTPQFMHPDMYITHLEGLKTPYKDVTDLWSTAITLYHAAVTSLPFIAFGDSYQSAQILKDMYLQKGRGIISGIQNSSNQLDITWSDKLPNNCRLSPMLKDLASKLIGNLMDLSPENSYNRFFEEANAILKKRRLLIFNSLNGELQLLYLDNLSYNSVVDHIAQAVGYPKEDLIILTKNNRLVQHLNCDKPCFRSLPIKGHLKYTLTDDTALVIVKKVTSEMVPLVTKGFSKNGCKRPLDKYNFYIDAKKYAETLMKSIYEVGSSANYIDCQIDCYLATMVLFNEYVLRNYLNSMNDALPWQLSATRDSCVDIDHLAQFAGSNTFFDNGIIQVKVETEKLRHKATENERCGEQNNAIVVTSTEKLHDTEQSFYGEYDSTDNDNLEFLEHAAEELVNEVMMYPVENMSKDNNYKLEIWQRHIRLFKYYELSKTKFDAKSERIKNMHQTFHSWLTPALDNINSFQTLKECLLAQEHSRIGLRTKFHSILDQLQDNFLRSLPIESASNHIVKDRIHEILDITETIRNNNMS